MEKIVLLLQTISLLLSGFSDIGYQVERIDVHDYPQKVYTLEILPTNERIVLGNGLARDQVFGFETTSDMVRRNQACAGVNGTIYNQYGNPLGMLMMRGQWVSLPTVGTPVVIVNQRGQVAFREIKATIHWRLGSQWRSINQYNQPLPRGGTGVFSDYFGRSNRVERPQTTYRLRQGNVVEVIKASEVVPVRGDLLITYSGESRRLAPRFIEGQSTEIEVRCYDRISNKKLDVSQWREIFQTGGWLVKDGQVVAKPYEPQIGHTTSLQPRTAIGVTDEGRLIIKVIDGRWRGGSAGLTGKWTAELMKQAGCVNAAMLDGGASSTLVMNQQVVNQPATVSDRRDTDKEKRVAHSLLFWRKWPVSKDND